MVLSLPRRDGEKISTGGFALKTLKKLKGLRLTSPFSSIVLAKAIGRGTTVLNNIPCISAVEILLGSIVFMGIYYKNCNTREAVTMAIMLRISKTFNFGFQFLMEAMETSITDTANSIIPERRM